MSTDDALPNNTRCSSQDAMDRDYHVPSDNDVSMSAASCCVATPQTSRANTPRPDCFHELENAKGTYKSSGMLNRYVYDWLRMPTSSMRLYETNAEHRLFLKGYNPKTPSPREKRFILKSGHLMEILDTFDAKASASISQWLISVSKDQSSHFKFLPGFAKTQEGMNMRKARWWPNCFLRNGLCICGI